MIPEKNVKSNWIRLVFPVGLFTAVFVSIVVSIMSQTYFDSDNAAEAFLAREMVRSGSLAPQSWIYSTELRTLHTQLFIAPLLAVTGDMMLSRNIANVMVVVLLAVAMFTYLRSLGLSWVLTLLTTSLVLTPLSSDVSHIMFMGAYYSPYLICILFTLAGLNRVSEEAKGIPRTLLLCVLLVVAFLLGLSGSRFLASLFLPLLIAEIFVLFKTDQVMDRAFLKQAIGSFGFISVLLIVVAGCAGYVLCKVLGAVGWHIFDYVKTVLVNQDDFVSNLQRVPGDMLSLFGGIQQAPLASFAGITALVHAVFLVVEIWICMLRTRDFNILPNREKRLILFFWSGLLITLTLIVFSTDLLGGRYYILPLFMGFPIVATYIQSRIPKTIGRVALISLVLLVIATAQYQVLVIEKTQTAGNSRQRQVAEYLMKNEYTFGYATFWNASAVSILTNGKVEIANIHDGLGLATHNWLSPKRYYDPATVPDKAFLLLDQQQVSHASPELMAGAEKVAEVSGFSIFVWPHNPFAKKHE